MPLSERDYYRDGLRNRQPLGNTSFDAPTTVITYTITTKKKDDNSAFGCGCLLVLVVLVVIIANVIGKGPALSHFFGFDRPGYGVYVCATENYDVDKVACTAADSMIWNLPNTRLAVSHHDALVSSSLMFTFSDWDETNQAAGDTICSTSLTGAPGENNVAYHLDEVLKQCGVSLKNKHWYQLDVTQDTESLGTAAFQYNNYWGVHICKDVHFDVNKNVCTVNDTELPKRRWDKAMFVFTGVNGANLTGVASITVSELYGHVSITIPKAITILMITQGQTASDELTHIFQIAGVTMSIGKTYRIEADEGSIVLGVAAVKLIQ